MDNTQKPSSPPTFDPLSPPPPPPPASPLGGLSPTFPQEPPPITPPPVAPSWPPAPEPAPVPPPPPPPTFPASPLPPPTPDLSSSWALPPIIPTSPPPNTSTSSLDNPWGAPPQPPPINAPSSTPPPWTPPASPSASPQGESLGGPQIPVETSDSPPTDLSHLVGNNSQPEPTPTNLNQAETLIVPSTVTPETTTEPLEHIKRGLPKWLIGVGAGLLIAVLGASAYFILGIGQAPKTTSLPAVDTSQTKQIKPPAPIATPPVQSPAPGDNSASFGELQGGGQQATGSSAIETLRQRQQQGR